jgi:hypothetical protein
MRDGLPSPARLCLWPLPHGHRGTYQRCGCRCLLCKAAEATYRANLRRRHLTGRPILGQRVSARRTWRRLRSLQIEGFSRADIAAKLGLRCRQLQLQTESITLRNALKVQRLYRTVMLECSPPSSSGSSLNI